MSNKIIVFGLGKIGNNIAHLLHTIGKYKVLGIDQHPPKIDSDYAIQQINISDSSKVKQLLETEKPNALISCLPFFLNISLAKLARELNISYFDLTEDTYTQQTIEELASGARCALVPQCGLAPGLIGIAGAYMTKEFDVVQNLQLRVGALPNYPTGEIKYARSWSTAGLVNEYINDCECIEHGKICFRAAMSGYETMNLDGKHFEAFHTSGGVGSLIKHFSGKIDTVDYKTLRHEGHRNAMLLLLNDLNFKQRPKELVKLLDANIPLTDQDQVIIFIKAVGKIQHKLAEKSCYLRFEACEVAGRRYSAIALTTALGACAMLEEVMCSKANGYIGHHDIDWQQMLQNKFGRLLHEASKQWSGI